MLERVSPTLGEAARILERDAPNLGEVPPILGEAALILEGAAPILDEVAPSAPAEPAGAGRAAAIRTSWARASDGGAKAEALDSRRSAG